MNSNSLALRSQQIATFFFAVVLSGFVLLFPVCAKKKNNKTVICNIVFQQKQV